MGRLVRAAVVLALAACSGTTSGQPAATPQLAPTASPTVASAAVIRATETPLASAPTTAPTVTPAPAALATLTPVPVAATTAKPASAPAPARTPINVDDMMGAVAQQTVFVAAPDHVSAVTLLNHFTRYRISTNSLARVSADGSEQRVYVLDADTPGLHRLRAFDVGAGIERAVQAGVAGVADDGRVLSALGDGRVLVLKSDATRAWVDAYEDGSLRLLGPVMHGPRCGDRLLTSARRIAVICLATGEITVSDLRGTQTVIDGALPNLVAAAMSDDGKLFVSTADRHFGTVAPDTTNIESVEWPKDWSGSVIPDGLAVAPGGAAAVIVQHTESGAQLRVFRPFNRYQRTSFGLAGVPHGGIVARWPFAYYAVDGSIRHVDLSSGLLETMAEVGAGAVPAAVVNS